MEIERIMTSRGLIQYDICMTYAPFSYMEITGLPIILVIVKKLSAREGNWNQVFKGAFV